MFPTRNAALGQNEPNWEGCEYSKCGRTDKGVSAFGQVIGIRVRSNRPVNRAQKPASLKDVAIAAEKTAYTKDMETTTSPVVSPVDPADDGTPTPSSACESPNNEAISFHPIQDEIPYCHILNRLLPPDIRMLAWCPNPPSDFSARFHCKERRYKYFFTQPAFTPTTGRAGLLPAQKMSPQSTGRRREGWLDINAMRDAARKFIGLHDFRNFCKVDPSKQTDNFQRRIFHADIEKIDTRQGPVGYVGKPSFRQYEHENDDTHQESHPDNDNLLEIYSSTPTIYTFTLHGSAFLWHQVRHMVAILFLIGQGLESPSLIDDLLDVVKTPTKPHYDMADDAPLVLWDCIFPQNNKDANDDDDGGSREDALEWVYLDDDFVAGKGGAVKVVGGAGKFGPGGGLVDDLWKFWRSRKMDEVLAGSLLDVVAGRKAVRNAIPGVSGDETVGHNSALGTKSANSQKVFQGGDAPRFVGAYVPVMRRPRMESVEVINARYAKRKGFEQDAEKREVGFRRLLGDAEGEE